MLSKTNGPFNFLSKLSIGLFYIFFTSIQTVRNPKYAKYATLFFFVINTCYLVIFM